MSSKFNKYNIRILTLGIYDAIKTALSKFCIATNNLRLQLHIILVKACYV